MDTTMYIIAIATVGCGVVCGLDHKHFEGELQGDIKNVLTMISTKERHKRTTNERPADESLLITQENIEDIFKPGPVDKTEQNNHVQQPADLSNDPALRANIESLFGPLEQTQKQYDQHSTDRNLLVDRSDQEPETDFDKVTIKNFYSSNDQHTTTLQQQPKLQTMIVQFFGPEIKTPSLETRDVESDNDTNIQGQSPEDIDTTTESGDDYRFQSKETLRRRFRNFLQASPISKESSFSNATSTTPKNEPTTLISAASVHASNRTRTLDDARISTEAPKDMVTSGWQAHKTSILVYVLYSLSSLLLIL